MTPPRILVTGGVGFLGSAIVRALAEKHPDWTVTVVDIRPKDSYSPDGINTEYIRADLTESAQALEAVETAQPTVIIHNAGIVPKVNARYSLDDHERVFKVNVEGTRNVLAAAKLQGVRYFVLTSSCTIITDDLEHDHPNMTEDLPTDRASISYGQSKAAAERLVLNANNPPHLLTTAIRPSVILGPGDDNLVPTIHACIAKGETPFIVGEGTNLYDFTYVTNVADAHVLAVENLLGSGTAAGENFFISNTEPVPFRAFMLAVWKEFGHIPPFQIRIPRPVAWFAGLMAEAWTWMTGTSATLSRGSVKDACQIGYADCSKARRILGYEPRISLVDGVRLACDEYKERLQKGRKVESNGRHNSGLMIRRFIGAKTTTNGHATNGVTDCDKCANGVNGHAANGATGSQKSVNSVNGHVANSATGSEKSNDGFNGHAGHGLNGHATNGVMQLNGH